MPERQVESSRNRKNLLPADIELSEVVAAGEAFVMGFVDIREHHRHAAHLRLVVDIDGVTVQKTGRFPNSARDDSTDKQGNPATLDYWSTGNIAVNPGETVRLLITFGPESGRVPAMTRLCMILSDQPIDDENAIEGHMTQAAQLGRR